jgi:hypothetical protein
MEPPQSRPPEQARQSAGVHADPVINDRIHEVRCAARNPESALDGA